METRGLESSTERRPAARGLAVRARVLAGIDTLVPPALAQGDVEEQRRARLTVAAAVLGASMVLTNTTISLLFGWMTPNTLVNLGLGGMFALTPVVLRRTRSVDLFANTLVAAGFVQLTVLIVISGATSLGAVYSFAVIPLAANLLAGWRAGFAWAVICVGGIVLCTGPLALTPFAVLPLPPGEALATHVRDAIALTLGIAVFGALYDVVRTLALRDAERARALAEASEEKFAGAFTSAPSLIAIIALDDLTILECNHRLVDALGAESREAVIGRHVLDLPGRPMPDHLEEIESQLRLSASFHEHELCVQMEDGTRWYLLSAAPMRMGERKCLIVSAHDITARKALEDQLRQAQKMEAIGQLAGGIAHDFNNMLTVISSYGDMLMTRLEGTDRDDLAKIMASAQRSAALTRRLLAFSRKQVLEVRTVDASELMHGLDDLLPRVITETVRIVYDLDPKAGAIRVDRGQIEQALMNLAINARDAMPEGGNLSLETQRVSLDADAGALLDLPPGDYVRLGVRDDGAGIPPEAISRVLDPFFTTKPEGEGTGLGLAMADGIARQSSGALQLTSEVGVGTTVDLYLPRSSEAETPAGAPEPAAAPAEVDGSKTILLVEDEEMIRAVVTQALAAEGYLVLTAENGEVGLALAKSHDGPIDLLLTDAVMPLMGGLELVERIHEDRPDTPVVLITGYPERPGGALKPLPAGVVVLEKPFTASSLRECIAEALALSQGRISR